MKRSTTIFWLLIGLLVPISLPNHFAHGANPTRGRQRSAVPQGRRNLPPPPLPPRREEPMAGNMNQSESNWTQPVGPPINSSDVGLGIYQPNINDNRLTYREDGPNYGRNLATVPGGQESGALPFRENPTALPYGQGSAAGPITQSDLTSRDNRDQRRPSTANGDPAYSPVQPLNIRRRASAPKSLDPASLTSGQTRSGSGSSPESGSSTSSYLPQRQYPAPPPLPTPPGVQPYYAAFSPSMLPSSKQQPSRSPKSPESLKTDSTRRQSTTPLMANEHSLHYNQPPKNTSPKLNDIPMALRPGSPVIPAQNSRYSVPDDLPAVLRAGVATQPIPPGLRTRPQSDHYSSAPEVVTPTKRARPHSDTITHPAGQSFAVELEGSLGVSNPEPAPVLTSARISSFSDTWDLTIPVTSNTHPSVIGGPAIQSEPTNTNSWPSPPSTAHSDRQHQTRPETRPVTPYGQPQTPQPYRQPAGALSSERLPLRHPTPAIQLTESFPGSNTNSNGAQSTSKPPKSPKEHQGAPSSPPVNYRLRMNLDPNTAIKPEKRSRSSSRRIASNLVRKFTDCFHGD